MCELAFSGSIGESCTASGKWRGNLRRLASAIVAIMQDIAPRGENATIHFTNKDETTRLAYSPLRALTLWPPSKIYSYMCKYLCVYSLAKKFGIIFPNTMIKNALRKICRQWLENTHYTQNYIWSWKWVSVVMQVVMHEINPNHYKYLANRTKHAYVYITSITS